MTAAAYRTAVLAVAAGLAACQAQAPSADPGPGAATPAAAASPAGPSTAAAGHEASPPAGSAAVANGIIESQWECDDQHVAARFDNNAGTVSVTHERGELLLPQVTSASGARYADANGNEFWNTGDQATLTLSGAPQRQCRDVGALRR